MLMPISYISDSSTVSGNTALGIGGSGGILNSTTMTLNNSTVSGNRTLGSATRGR